MMPSILSRASSTMTAMSGMIPSPIDRTREGTPTPGATTPGAQAPYAALNVKKVTLTSKKNWWLGELKSLRVTDWRLC